MKDFYTRYFVAAEQSQAHHVFCERVFGTDLCQHGFADLGQLELIVQVTGLGPASHVLDVGCGNGRIAEYLSDRTGAHITGLDYIPEAIDQARIRTAAKSERLTFMVGDINQLEIPANAFDVVLSIDSLYFSNDTTATLRDLKTALKAGGQMAILYSYGREPWIPMEEFPKENLAPERTPLAEALRANDLKFQAWDLTQQDYALALERKKVLAELRPQFESEDTLFIYENRMGDAEGISQAIEDGLHARYLYHVQHTGPGITSSIQGGLNRAEI